MLLNQFPVIPHERIADVESALQAVFQTNEITDLALLAGGLSGSAVYRIELQGKSYTLKLTPPVDEPAETNLALRQAVTAGIAPALYYDNQSKGIMISDFIRPQPISAVFSPEQLLSELATAIKVIHQIPFEGSSISVFEKVDELTSEFQAQGKLRDTVFDECFERYETIKQQYPLAADDQVFSHNDLNPNNILCDGKRLWMIDWDVASLNNRYIDLANVANFFIRTEEQENAFLTIYFGQAPTAYQTACFHVMRQISRLLYALLMFRLALQSKPADYLHNQEMEGIDLPAFGAMMAAGKLSLAEYDGQLMFGKALINTALVQMRSDRFIKELQNL